MTTIETPPSDFFMLSAGQRRPMLSFCDANLASLQRWLAKLPVVQLGDSSKLLFNALIEVSELECDELLRFDLIQTLHLPIEQVLGLLEKQFIDQSHHLSAFNYHTIELAQQFRCYLARIYLDIAQKSDQTIQNNQISLFAFKQKKALSRVRTLSTYYALEQFSLLRFQQTVVYTNRLMGQSLAGHHLFKLAQQHKFQSEKIQHIQTNTSKLTTITQIYTQILLMDILNTHQIRPIEITALYQCTFQWVNLIGLSTHENSHSRYFVDLESDLPPSLNSVKKRTDESIVFIEVKDLVKHINLANLENNPQISAIERRHLSPSLIFHLQHVLNSLPERRYERYNFNSTVQMVFSIQSAHFHLSHGLPFQDTLQLGRKVNVQQQSAKSLSTWNSDVASANQHYKTLNPESKQVHSCTVIDISVNGYRMRSPNPVPKQLRTGEFILVQENEKSPWRGGTVRWLKQNKDQSFEFGVEVLSDEITPCAVQLTKERDLLSYQPALILKNQVLNEAHLSIIVWGSQTFKSQQGVFLRLGERNIKIYLNEAKVISQSFSQLQFELLNSDEQILLDQFIQQHAETLKKQDLWESLK
ncbi:PilZ domain-containing protein [Acinetobacter sp. MD2(2019)]|uniref:PilZ domain-containing protein n=1 Tax=Acinetobacter sp. MD2(2019) TaxID=2605273 RepID=UPI002D1F662C|nr:PilZ domain-containing protein [Acinetobacter sp. MD2(2019)]MEB3754063.1 PilZ domain-containing protein [Acinetobacter sp. MD2(2019)]